MLAVIYTLYSFDSYWKTASQLEVAAKRLTELKGASGGRADIAKSDSKQLKKEIEFINSVIIKRTFSWTGLLTDLEGCVPEGAYIVQISPDFAQGKVSVMGMAREVRLALSMVDLMTGSGRFSDVFLTKHSGAAEGAGMTLFSITASYNGGTIKH